MKSILENIIPISITVALWVLIVIPLITSIKNMPSYKKDPDYIKWEEEQRVKNGR